ncbi:MAG: hypothetical protein ABFD89_17695 [Bryobacteraceae bacterium]
MSNPGQTITQRDGGLGLSGTPGTRFLFVGCSSGGSAGLSTHTSSTSLQTAQGGGPLVVAGSWSLDGANKEKGKSGPPIDVLKVAGSVAASNSAITKSGSGPTVTVSGNANCFYSAIVTPVVGGVLGTGTFKYSLDGGQFYSEVLTIPTGGTYVIPNSGLTLTFPAGTYVAAETYTFTTIPATYNLSDLTAAWPTLMAAYDRWPVIVFTGHSATASAAAVLSAGIDVLCAQLVNGMRYPRVLMSTGEDVEATILSAFASVQTNLIAHFASKVPLKLFKASQGWGNPTLPFVYEAARRASMVGLGTNPAWVGLKDPNLYRVGVPVYDATKSGSALYDAKINAPCTYPGRAVNGKPLVYSTGFLLKSAPGSDFKHFQWGRVLDEISDAVQLRQQEWVNGNLEVMTDGTGRILPEAAKDLEQTVLGDIKRRIVNVVRDDGKRGWTSGVPKYEVDRTVDILTTGLLKSGSKAVPLANTEQVATEIGFATQI